MWTNHIGTNHHSHFSILLVLFSRNLSMSNKSQKCDQSKRIVNFNSVFVYLNYAVQQANVKTESKQTKEKKFKESHEKDDSDIGNTYTLSIGMECLSRQSMNSKVIKFSGILDVRFDVCFSHAHLISFTQIKSAYFMRLYRFRIIVEIFFWHVQYVFKLVLILFNVKRNTILNPILNHILIQHKIQLATIVEIASMILHSKQKFSCINHRGCSTFHFMDYIEHEES